MSNDFPTVTRKVAEEDFPEYHTRWSLTSTARRRFDSACRRLYKQYSAISFFMTRNYDA